MFKKMFWEILVMAFIGMMTLAGCSSLSDSTGIISSPSISVNPPSTSYPVDIEGTVIVTRSVIINGQLNSVGLQSQYLWWIVRLSIRNKEQISIADNEYTWQMLSKNDTSLPNSLIKVWDCTTSDILPGQTGTWVLEYYAPINSDPNDYQIEFISTNPFSIGNLTFNELPVNYYDWDTQKVLASYTPPTTKTQSVPTIAKNSIVTWSHTGFVETTMQGYGAGSYSSITFQNGFALTFVGTVGGYFAPAIGDKVKVTYYYDSSLGGNVITSCQPVQ